MDPHNDFDKHDRPPVICRCGHERDDHGSTTEQRDGEKVYVQRVRMQPYYDEVFRRLERRWPVRVHLFGVISQWVLERYPLYSADSASATIGGANGILHVMSRGRSSWVHWKEYSRRTLDASVADGLCGATAHEARLARWTSSVRSIDEMSRYATELWERRGVSWQ